MKRGETAIRIIFESFIPLIFITSSSTLFAFISRNMNFFYTDTGCHLENLPRGLLVETDKERKLKESVLSVRLDDDDRAKILK